MEGQHSRQRKQTLSRGDDAGTPVLSRREGVLASGELVGGVVALFSRVVRVGLLEEVAP